MIASSLTSGSISRHLSVTISSRALREQKRIK
jgi:hypothetical protein